MIILITDFMNFFLFHSQEKPVIGFYMDKNS